MSNASPNDPEHRTDKATGLCPVCYGIASAQEHYELILSLPDPVLRSLAEVIAKIRREVEAAG